MKKALKRISALALMLALVLCAFCLAACGGDKSYTVTFDMNGAGIDNIEVSVESGETVNVPSDPESGYGIFSGWYSDKECTENFDFTTAIKSDTTVYAGWVTVPDGSIALTFMWNYGSLGVYSVGVITSGKPLTASDLPTPTREGYMFAGWYLESTCETGVGVNNAFTESVTLYAGWVLSYRFEAELTNLYTSSGEMREFYGYSQDGFPITANSACSNGYYFTSLYYQETYMYFEITSDCDCTAELYMSCGMEYGWGLDTGTVTISSSEFKITVNGGDAINYSTMSFDVKGLSSGAVSSFSEFYIGTIDLKAGENTIRMETANTEEGQGGSQHGKAPSIDYIVINADAQLSMTVYDNV